MIFSNQTFTEHIMLYVLGVRIKAHNVIMCSIEHINEIYVL